MLQMPENLVKIILDVMREKITGCIEIHFFQGNAVKVKRTEEQKI